MMHLNSLKKNNRDKKITSLPFKERRTKEANIDEGSVTYPMDISAKSEGDNYLLSPGIAEISIT